ncbi:polygalacturonase non-catalytic subunit AroGP2-like, partial [Trifolium medium]|nr:polygalacturonase non-catalytic subunit AroGP2-like [Trifolium medium]
CYDFYDMVVQVALAAAGEVVPEYHTEKDLIQKYWKKHIKNNFSPPTFLMNQASPLTLADSKKYQELVAGGNLQSVISDFCSDAGLFCNVGHFLGDAFFYHQFSKEKYDVLEHETLEVPFPGIFFRERQIKEGTIMMMGDIQDMTLKRYFLPRSLASKLPFSSSKMGEMKKMWNKVFDEKTLDKMIKYSTYECQRKAARDETKLCANSIEDIIDFSKSLLGPNITVRTTENGNGAMENILLGHIKAINGGNVSRSLTCHAYLFPYMMYYCHSVPAVRIYDVEILDIKNKTKINQAIIFPKSNLFPKSSPL